MYEPASSKPQCYHLIYDTTSSYLACSRGIWQCKEREHMALSSRWSVDSRNLATQKMFHWIWCRYSQPIWSRLLARAKLNRQVIKTPTLEWFQMLMSLLGLTATSTSRRRVTIISVRWTTHLSTTLRTKSSIKEMRVRASAPASSTAKSARSHVSETSSQTPLTSLECWINVIKAPLEPGTPRSWSSQSQTLTISSRRDQ